MKVRVWDVGKSERRSVIERIRAFNVARHESEPTSDWCLFARKNGEHLKREEQREVEVVRPPAGAAPPLASPEPGVYRVSIAEVARL